MKKHNDKVEVLTDKTIFKKMKPKDKFYVSTIALGFDAFRKKLANKEDVVFFPQHSVLQEDVNEFTDLLEEYKDYVHYYSFKEDMFDIFASTKVRQIYKSNAYFFRFKNEEYYKNMKYGANAKNLSTIYFNIDDDKCEQMEEKSRVCDTEIINMAKKLIDDNIESFVKWGDFIVSGDNKIIFTNKYKEHKEFFIKTKDILGYYLIETNGKKNPKVYQSRPTRMNYLFHISHKDEMTQIDNYDLWYGENNSFETYL